MSVVSNRVCASPKVSVAMITYNHERYIAQAVTSVLNQQTSFPFEIVVGDDCSTDGTRDILRELAAKNPDRVRLLFHEKNLGQCGKLNLVATIGQCTGDYVALLEGDDFWNATDKLQKQAAFLDANSDCSGCCHDVWTLFPDGRVDGYPQPFPPACTRLGPAEVLAHGFPLTSSILYRRGIFGPFPDWYFEMVMGDWPLSVLCMGKKPFGFLRGEFLSTYRVHPGSYWNNRPLVNRTLEEIKAFEAFGRFLGPKFDRLVQLQLNRRQFYLAYGYDEQGDGRSARTAFRRFLRGYPRHRSVSGRAVARLGFKLAAPGLFSGFKTWYDRRRQAGRS